MHGQGVDSVEIVELQLFFQKRAISIERMGGSEKSVLRLTEISGGGL
jgi:hypothetical protein